MKELIKIILNYVFEEDFKELQELKKELQEQIIGLEKNLEGLKLKQEEKQKFSIYSHIYSKISYENTFILLGIIVCLGGCLYISNPDTVKELLDQTKLLFNNTQSFSNLITSILDLEMKNTAELEKEIQNLMLKIQESNLRLAKLEQVNHKNVMGKLNSIIDLYQGKRDQRNPSLHINPNDID